MDNSQQHLQIAFIGAGRMSYCLISGLLKKGYDQRCITASAQHQTSLTRLLQRLNQQSEKEINLITSTANTHLVKQADIVVLAVKPVAIKNILQQICEQDVLGHKPLIVTLAAGISITYMLAHLQREKYPIVRSMPNTPAQLGLGMTGLYANACVTTVQRNWIEALFQSLGKVLWVDAEQKLDTVTAISGSGPAYFFYIVEILEQIATEQGLPAHQASQLVRQTMLGAAHMLMQEEISPEQLREQVTSPGGSTEQAINVLKGSKLYTTFKQAIIAAKKRTEEFNNK